MGETHFQKWYPAIQGMAGFRQRRLIPTETSQLCNERETTRRNLYTSLYHATQVVEDVANGLYSDYQGQRLSSISGLRGHYFGRVSPPPPQVYIPDNSRYSLMDYARSWLATHEDTQVMVASVLVVVGLWWLVRAVFALLINLVCPLLVVILAVLAESCICPYCDACLGKYLHLVVDRIYSNITLCSCE